jgi:MoxR-like ATPase
MRLQMGYPQPADELEILRVARSGYDSITQSAAVTRAEVLRLQALVSQVFVEDSVLDYILRIVTATRSEAEFKTGVSVRGGLALRTAAQARALVQGRDFVLPDDVVELVTPILGHRLSLARQTSDALEERRAVVTVLRRILAALTLPT